VANNKFVVRLCDEERERLKDLISKGKAAAKTILKARILLKADQSETGESCSDEQICEALDTNVSMVAGVRAKLVEEGLDAVLTRRKRETPPIQPIFDGEKQAQLIALACSQPPEGHAHWTIRLLAEHVVERRIVPAAHFNTVGRALRKLSTYIRQLTVLRHDGSCAFS
jgi:Homeodomain-like domain